MGKIIIAAKDLFKEADATPADLMRAGLGSGTAYSLYHGRGKGIEYDTLEVVCDFFSEKLGRPIGPGDILKRQDNPPAN